MTEVTVWHDGGCPLRRREIALMRRLDRRGAIEFVDAGSAGTCPVGRDELLARLHAREDGRMLGGAAVFAVGAAGSTGLVLQTVLMPLAMADAPSRLVLEGGTHNMLAPPFDFIAKSFLPVINRMGPTVAARLVRPGFYPRGGGGSK